MNFSLLHCVGGNGIDKEKVDKKCEKHPANSLKFYCKTHDVIICQDCMLSDHLGPGHEISSAEKILHISIISSDTKRCMEKVEDSLKNLKSSYAKLQEESVA